MAVALQNSVQIPDSLQGWLQQCPSPETLKALLEEYVWMNTKTKCYECEEKYLRKDLRYDEASPIGDPNTLICQSCWHYWDEGSIHDPDYRPPPWPERLIRQKFS